jgi:16S rRNA processing protein RimM
MVKDRILVGRFGAPHGVGGELRLTSFTGVPGAIVAYNPLFDASGTRRFSILSLRPIKHNMFVAKIAGVGDRASARALTHAELFVLRASLPDVGGEEFYLADLIGLAVINEAGGAFGSVVNVLNFAGGDILEIACPDRRETLLLPFTKAVFPRVDIEAGHLTVVPPVGIEIQADLKHPLLPVRDDLKYL